jgi:hypothetical protein
MTQTANPDLPAGRAATIAELISAVGVPRSRAEHIVVELMRQLDKEHAQVRDQVAEYGSVSVIQVMLSERQHGLWVAAVNLYYSVLAFREHGDDAPPGSAAS